MKNLPIHLVRVIVALAALCLSACCYGNLSQQILHSFGASTNDGLTAFAGLVQGRDGAFYGTTHYGGSNNAGTVFKLNSDGTSYRLLHTFLTNGIDGQNPAVGGDLLQGRDGALYGMTTYGGANTTGTIFRIGTNGANYTVLHDFEAVGNDNDPHPAPVGSLIQGTDGNLYGVSAGGSVHDHGRVFRWDASGLHYILIFNAFPYAPYGMYPAAGLIQGRDGALYGTTENSVFKVKTDGSGAALLHAFATYPIGTDPATNTDGYYSHAPLLEGRDGMLYGTTRVGGRTYTNGDAYRYGTVFRQNPTNAADYAVIHFFGTPTNSVFANADGLYPVAGLMQASDGTLYGTTEGGGQSSTAGDAGTVFALNPDGTGYRVIFNFNYNHGGGYFADARVVQGSDGAFYGTTSGGGGYDTAGTYAGTIYRLDGNFTRLRSFGANSTDAAFLQTGLAQGSDGTLYGTSENGGTNGGFGTVFKVSPNGMSYAPIYSFTGGTNGGLPSAGVLVGRDGLLYGTTALGGNAVAGVPFSGAGTVFRLNPNGLGYNVLYRFNTNGTDGQHPAAELIQTSDGVLYGTTAAGGSNNVGTVFKLNTNGTGYTQLHTFVTNGIDGQRVAGVIQGADSGLYGTTSMGGTNHAGTVFSLRTNGTGYAVLYHFKTNGSDGQNPSAGLVQADGAVLYGTTSAGGSNDVGTVFNLNTNGTGYAVMHHFSTNGFDGRSPSAALILASDGALYGTTQAGGIGTTADPLSGLGTVFRLNCDGAGYAVVRALGGFDGSYPSAPLVQGGDGALYGTTTFGGTNNLGTVFRLALSTSGRFTSFAVSPTKSFQFSVTGGALDYRIDASTDLVSWVPLTNVVNTVGPVFFTDPNMLNFPRRFFRTVWLP